MIYQTVEMADRFSRTHADITNADPAGIIKDKSDMARNFSTIINEPTYTSQQALLSLELLKETGGMDPALIKRYAIQETKYIAEAMDMLDKDRLVAAQMGGISMANALKLADILHKQASDKEMEKVLEPSVQKLVPNLNREKISTAFGRSAV